MSKIPSGTSATWAMPLISSLKGCGSVSTISGCQKHTHKRFIMLQVETKIENIIVNYNKYNQAPAKCRPATWASHRALRRLPGLWLPWSWWPASRRRAGVVKCHQPQVKLVWRVQRCFPTSAFLSLITVVHLLLGGKSRSTVYQLTACLNLVGQSTLIISNSYAMFGRILPTAAVEECVLYI